MQTQPKFISRIWTPIGPAKFDEMIRLKCKNHSFAAAWAVPQQSQHLSYQQNRLSGSVCVCVCVCWCSSRSNKQISFFNKGTFWVFHTSCTEVLLVCWGERWRFKAQDSDTGDRGLFQSPICGLVSATWAAELLRLIKECGRSDWLTNCASSPCRVDI